ncbi:GAD-like domain-containing protein [Roseinatronobacter alkalisoli]|uniref:GAD-like domain-containing protein n=1 Tax=Roseinatronobacter alkalisoli TaxID=3028235 RepID=A0ABT5TED4_9RHOB|nr:GAD-like domain-containing protein [Roseinatronobacter sp. HJB301]MDD7973483.1 GAD-like domain-containing protein [Roseinatronobacter sp. HJB301]
MSAQDFLDYCGSPKEPIRLDPELAPRFAARVPTDLVSFWIDEGIGSYADDNYRTCTPDLFDPLLSILLAKSVELRPDDLAAIGYSCLGCIDLWHRAGRHFVYSMDVGLLIDMTSKNETEPLPYDLAALYAAADTPLPDDPIEGFLSSRSRPEDVWMILMSGASPDGYDLIEDDDLRPLVPQLQTSYGGLAPGEIYLRRDLRGPHLAQSYERINLSDAQRLLPETVLYSRSIEIDGNREEVSVRIPVTG